MRKNIFIFFAVLSLLLSSNFAKAALIPVGIQTDTAVADILSGGWSVLYRENTGLTSSISDVFGGLNEDDWILVAGIRNSDDVALVYAAVTWSAFSTYTLRNNTHTFNDVDWYFNGYSMGFTSVGDPISQTTADTSAFINGNLGLTIHTNYFSGSNAQAASNFQDHTIAPTYFGSGYRFANVTMGNGETGYDFAFFTTSRATPVNAPGTLFLMMLALAGLVFRNERIK